MNETEYIIITNRVRISSALQNLREVTHGEQYGISEDNYRCVTKVLAEAEMELFSIICDDSNEEPPGNHFTGSSVSVTVNGENLDCAGHTHRPVHVSKPESSGPNVVKPNGAIIKKEDR